MTLLCVIAMHTLIGQTHWTPATGFADNANVSAVLFVDGTEQFMDYVEIGAFCGEQCRGAELPYEIEGQIVYFLTIKGNPGDLITFRLWDHHANAELEYECATTYTFVINDVLGEYPDWYQLNFTTPVSAFHFTTAGNWSTASNWQGGSLPGTGDEVFIDANCTLDQNAEVTSLTVTEGKSLTLQTGKTLIVSGTLTNASATGLVLEDGSQLVNTSADVAATVEKRITAFVNPDNSDGWYTIASPVDKMTIAGSSFLTETYDLYRYVESNMQQNEWENYRAHTSEFTIFENGRGYLYANSNSFSPEFVGTLNNAAVTYALTCTNRPDDLDGFNLIGNPFPHNIYKGAGGAIDNANLASGFYTLTNSGAWETHTFEDAILPEQGILVKTTQAGNLTITKTNAASTAESSAKNIAGRIRLNVEGTTGEDRAFVYFSEGTGLQKMPNFSETAPSLYVHNNGDFAITHASTDCESLDLMFKNNQSGSFTLSVDIQNLRFSYLHLIDRIAGTDTDLLQTPEYGFSATGNEYAARFQLVFKVMTGVEETVEEAPFAFVSGGQIIMNATGNLQIVDMTGRVVFADKISGNVSTVGMTPGVYVLRLADGNSVKVQKIIIK